MSNMNFDENTINKLKDMMNKGELNDVISQIPPEMIQNFSSMMSHNNIQSNPNNDENGHSNHNVQNSNNSFDFSNIDMNTILKMKSIMDKMNNSNDPRSNLLYSLKPYLREGRKEKIDQYANLLNIAKMTELFKDTNTNMNNNNNKEENSK